MGSCFLSFLEAQAKMLSAASDVMGPLGAYKEVGKGLSDSPTNSVVKEATVGWLAAAQVSCVCMHVHIWQSILHVLCLQ